MAHLTSAGNRQSDLRCASKNLNVTLALTLCSALQTLSTSGWDMDYFHNPKDSTGMTISKLSIASFFA